jgi:hypothetical protein
LVVAGRHYARVRRPLVLTVDVDGRRVGRMLVRHRGAFEQSLALGPELRGLSHRFTLTSAWTWRPGHRSADTRRLACLLDRVEIA